MDNLDQKIEQALRTASIETDIIDEPSVVEEVLASFSGQYKFLLVSAWIKAGVAILIFFFSVFQYFQQESVMALLAYASLALICLLTICTIYILFWITLNKNITNREVKRLELQIALLINKLDRQYER